MEVSDQLHAPAALLPGKEPLVLIGHGGWVDSRAGLDMVLRKIPNLRQDSNPNHSNYSLVKHSVMQMYRKVEV
jgi:hypothetical protein